MEGPLATIDEIDKKLDSGQLLTFEDAADLVEQTATGQGTMALNKLERALLYKRFANAQELTIAIRGMKATRDALERGPKN